MLFASYLTYCLLRRSDRDAVKYGFEPVNQMDLFCLYREETRAFSKRESKLKNQTAVKITA